MPREKPLYHDTLSSVRARATAMLEDLDEAIAHG